MSNPRYDPSRRRRRHAPASHHSPLTSLVTTAAVAYGAYKLGSWAYNTYFCEEDDEESVREEEDGDDLLYEWTDDNYRSVKRDIRKEEGFPFDMNEEETDSNKDPSPPNSKNNIGMKQDLRRSRRSRINWSDSHERSASPSPPQDYHHHHNQDEGKKEPSNGGGGSNGIMKKTASELGGAVTAGITAGIHAYNQNSSAQSTILEQERRVRMGRCRLETTRAMIDFLPTLKKAITKETDVSAQTDELKRLRIRKREILETKQQKQNGDDESLEEILDEGDVIREKERCLWNDIKNKSITRLVTTVYAHTIVFLVLTVQVNLLGGRLLREEQEEKSKPSSSSLLNATDDRYRTSHQTVLEKTYHYLFAKGIPSLAESVGDAVNEILQQWDVFGDDVSLRDVSTWLERVRDKIEQRRLKDDDVSPLIKFVIPPEGEANISSDDTDELARYILDETYDLLESPTFANAERQCLDTTFNQLQTMALGKLFLEEDCLPLANVVTHMQKTAVSTFHKPPSHKEEMQNWGGVFGMMEEPLPSVPNEYISRLERLDAVLELSDVCF